MLFALLTSMALAAPGARAEGKAKTKARCPSEMVKVHDYCVDRWEVSTVDARSNAAFSPYYPPNSKLAASARDAWLIERALFGDTPQRELPLPDLPDAERGASFEPRAVSQAGVVPQAYLSFHLAKLACENAGKRLCTRDEWVSAKSTRLNSIVDL